MSLLTTDTLCQKIYSEITSTVASQHLAIHLGIIMVGNHPASSKFIALKEKKATSLGYQCSIFNLPEDASTPAILELINRLNANTNITGIIIQLPLPAHLDGWAITNTISPDKDVDCLTSTRMGSFLTNCHTIMPGTAQAISYLCDHYQIRPKGKNVTIIGASTLVGKPAAIWFLQQNATVTICHEYTTNLEEIVKNSDMVVSATGKSELIADEWLNQEQVIIDIGIQIKDGKTIGDRDSNRIKEKVAHITPVPGGIGPLTVAVLMKNLIDLYFEKKNNA